MLGKIFLPASKGWWSIIDHLHQITELFQRVPTPLNVEPDHKGNDWGQFLPSLVRYPSCAREVWVPLHQMKHLIIKTGTGGQLLPTLVRYLRCAREVRSQTIKCSI